MSVAIVTSSISCLPAEQVQKYGIKVVPMPFMLNGHSYLDGVDISATEVYEQLAYERPFRTSAPSPGDYLKVYREALSDIAAAEAAAAGATLEEIKRLIANLEDEVRLYGLIVAPKYLARTGRVPAPLPSAASALSIKPVFTIAQGRIKLVSVVRTEKAGVDRMLSMMHTDVGRKPVHVIIQHANVPRQAENLRQRVQDDFNCTELRVTEFSPIIGFATGPGCLDLAFRADN